MPFKDIREFIAKCEETGDCQIIEEEVDWDLEVGGIARRCCELSAPAPFFQKIKDYPKGYRIFANPLATFRRLSIALDLKPSASYSEILDVYNERMSNPIKPNLVSYGPCKENVHLGNEVDLFEIPAPLIHGGDGGRYISTWHLLATKDPDSGWVNWGMYRQMIHSKDTLSCLILPNRHIGMIYEKCESRNRPMEFAVAIAPEPISTFLATSSIPAGVSEVDIAGGLRKEPLDMVKCETVDLTVPATSEIVIEGEMLPKVRKDEGPFGEYVGYSAVPVLPMPVGKIKAITHRNDPILTMSNMGVAIDDWDVAGLIPLAATLRSALWDAGIPITGICLPPEANGSLCVVATKTPYPGIASQIAGIIWANNAGWGCVKVIVVDDDIDYTNLSEVIHAWVTKCHPVRGTIVNPHSLAVISIPYYTPEERASGMDGANVVYDCTWPTTWKEIPQAITRRSSFAEMYPEAIKKKILEKWAKYGLKG